KPFSFMQLPLELREQIYSLYFRPADHLVKSPALEANGFFGGVYQWSFALSCVSKQIYAESQKVWRRENAFIKIATPWPSAVNHISSEGLVPIVCTDARADSFTGHHAEVHITAPFHEAVPDHTVVMLADDVHLFTRTWHYSALSYPMLNERLSTTFTLRNPDPNPDPDPAMQVPLPLQRRLLLPFEAVKGLHDMHIHGYAPVVQQELRTRQALPVPTLQEACETATDIMLAGDKALATHNDNNAVEALELYRRAFRAIHILIHGRTRRVLADVFFHGTINHGRYKGQTGSTVRVMLRLKLVSRTIAACNALGQFGDAAFWGMRSINIMSESSDSGFEDFLSSFRVLQDVGLIYLRTAIAFSTMEKDSEA
ncbi:hypothetical protein BDW02DRAFT_472231, partial [Decorospora gaudefroyi]